MVKKVSLDRLFPNQALQTWDSDRNGMRYCKSTPRRLRELRTHSYILQCFVCTQTTSKCTSAGTITTTTSSVLFVASIRCSSYQKSISPIRRRKVSTFQDLSSRTRSTGCEYIVPLADRTGLIPTGICELARCSSQPRNSLGPFRLTKDGRSISRSAYAAGIASSKVDMSLTPSSTSTAHWRRISLACWNESKTHAGC